MAKKSIRTLDIRTRRKWRSWLQTHHDSVSEIWLICHKRHTGVASMSYDDAVEEAICFGWIDSLVKRLDDERFARKFTPRTENSKWSTLNRRRYADLKTRGLLTAAGLERAPTGRSGDAPRRKTSTIPMYIKKQLRACPAAQHCFLQLTARLRTGYVTWVDSAKRQETKERRLRELIDLLAQGKRLGLK